MSNRHAEDFTQSRIIHLLCSVVVVIHLFATTKFLNQIQMMYFGFPPRFQEDLASAGCCWAPNPGWQTDCRAQLMPPHTLSAMGSERAAAAGLSSRGTSQPLSPGITCMFEKQDDRESL